MFWIFVDENSPYHPFSNDPNYFKFYLWRSEYSTQIGHALYIIFSMPSLIVAGIFWVIIKIIDLCIKSN